MSENNKYSITNKNKKKKERNNPEISLSLCLLKIIKRRNKEVFQKTS